MVDPRQRSRAVRATCWLSIGALILLGVNCGDAEPPGADLESSAVDGGALDLRGEPKGAAERGDDAASCDVGPCGEREPARPDRDQAPSKSTGSSDDGAANRAAAPRDSRAPRNPAPRRPAFVSIDDRLHTIHSDLRAVDNPSDRERLRYIDLTPLANAGASEAQLDTYRQAVALLVNSLSTGRAIVLPRAVDDDGLVLGIDLRDYAWDDATWEQIVRDYPYAVAYDRDSRLFPFDEDTAEQNRDETGTDIPAIEGDWFLAHAALSPLYYDVLRLPGDIGELARGLGIDIVRDIRGEQVIRAGLNSAEALNNRVIQRHEQPGLGGMLWLSFDFRANDGDRNVFAHPLDFQHDAGSGLFNLPNGLQAYFLMDANFRRVDRADPAIVSDPNSRNHIMTAGLSCMAGCHLLQGVMPAEDLVRAQAAATVPDAAAREAVLALYPDADTTRALIEDDAARYERALRQTGFESRDKEALSDLVLTHQDVLDLTAAAATLGISVDEVRDALEANAAAFPPEVLVLRQRGGTIHRDTFDAVFGRFAEALGLGRPIVPLFSRRRGP